MEIKEAIENIKESEKVIFREYLKSLDVIADAIRVGYTLCKVDEAIAKIKQKAWKEDSIEVEDCVDILKEACL